MRFINLLAVLTASVATNTLQVVISSGTCAWGREYCANTLLEDYGYDQAALKKACSLDESCNENNLLKMLFTCDDVNRIQFYDACTRSCIKMPKDERDYSDKCQGIGLKGKCTNGRLYCAHALLEDDGKHHIQYPEDTSWRNLRAECHAGCNSKEISKMLFMCDDNNTFHFWQACKTTCIKMPEGLKDRPDVCYDGNQGNPLHATVLPGQCTQGRKYCTERLLDKGYDQVTLKEACSLDDTCNEDHLSKLLFRCDADNGISFSKDCDVGCFPQPEGRRRRNDRCYRDAAASKHTFNIKIEV